MTAGEILDEERLARLIDVGRGLTAELDLDLLLDRVLETARELTGARYAALGILDRHRHRLERFVTRGVDEQTHQAIGDLPHGRGVLGVLIADPRPLRPPDARSALLIPLVHRGAALGLLAAFDRLGEETAFTADDEVLAEPFVTQAATAVAGARNAEASACAARGRRPRASEGAGRASCTTRRSRPSAG